jgi:chemotaxis signal transduction protein
VVELHILWDIEFEDTSQKAKLVVLNTSDAKMNLAIRVDRLREIIVLGKKKIKAPKGRNKNHFSGVSTYKSTDISVLDVDAIISSLAIV